MQAITPSRFPPSFDDSAWAYGFALFGLTLLCSMAVALLVANTMEGRINRQISSRLVNPVRQPWNAGTTLLSLYRFKINCLLSVIIMGAVPDVIFLLAWGEASDRTIEVVFMTDRICDGLAVVPFLLFVGTFLLSGGAVSHRLALDGERIELSPKWSKVREKVKIGVYAFLIAVGVTLYKASA